MIASGVHWFPSNSPVGVVMSMRAPWSAANLSIIRALREEEGLSLRDAVKRAAKELGLSRNELYRLAVED